MTPTPFVDAQLTKAQALRRKGDATKAEALLRNALQVTTQLRDTHGMAAIHLELARSLTEAGMALQHLDQALRLCRHLRQDDLLLQAVSMRVERLLELGDIPLATAGFEEVRALADGAQAPCWGARIACLEALLAGARKAHHQAAGCWETAAAQAQAGGDAALAMYCRSQVLLSRLRASETLHPGWLTTLPAFLADWLALGTPADRDSRGSAPTDDKPEPVGAPSTGPLTWCCEIAQVLTELDAADHAWRLLTQAALAADNQPQTSPDVQCQIRLAQAGAALQRQQDTAAGVSLSQAARLLPLLAPHHQDASRASWLLLSAQWRELHGDWAAAFRHRVALRALESKLQQAQLRAWAWHRESSQHGVSGPLTAAHAGAGQPREGGDTGAAVPQALTPQQHAVLQQLCQGKTNKAIALALGLSPLTVRQHVSDILSRWGVSTRAAAVARAAALQPPVQPPQAMGGRTGGTGSTGGFHAVR
jgi:DNA-binding CsgD family transcriptional regulator